MRNLEFKLFYLQSLKPTDRPVISTNKELRRHFVPTVLVIPAARQTDLKSLNPSDEDS